jgi:hypothetical protein
MTEVMIILGIIVSLVLIAGSVILNFRVGYRSADTELDAWVYGCCAGAADGLKAVAPFAAYWGWKNKDWLAVATAVCVFVAISSYTFSAEFGFAAQQRAFKQGERSGATEKRGDVRRAFERAEAKLVKMGAQRSVEEIEKAIESAFARPVGERSRTVDQVSSRCTLNRKETRKECAEIGGLTEEAARAREYVRLDGEVRALRLMLDSMSTGSGRGTGDAQIDAIESAIALTPFKVERSGVEVVLSALVALFIELGSGLGLYISTTPWRGGGLGARGYVGGKRTAKTTKNETTPQVGSIRPEKDAAAMVLGSVEEFMLERLELKLGRELSAGDVFAAYRSWCGKRGSVPFRQHEFGRQFSELAKISRIGFSGVGGQGVYLNVAVVRA